MRKPLIAGNWKMHKTGAETEDLIKDLLPLLDGAKAEAVVCPPFTALHRASAALAGSPVALGAQNVSWENSGALTGELAPAMLTELGVSYAIVGHSERRQYFCESDDTVNRRALNALAGGLTPIVCVGERLEERESGATNAIVESQIRGAFANFTADQAHACVVAYEPVWAIGTGKVATPEQAQEVHALIRGILADLFGADTAESIRIQYGGSVKPDNAATLFAAPDIDGALVGGASLAADSFAAIVRAAE